MRCIDDWRALTAMLLFGGLVHACGGSGDSDTCDPDNPLGDPWQVLQYAQDALGTQLLGLILAFLILAYGVL